MNDDPASQKHEIVIVRRRGGDDMAAGKGGAWKIAYADFVTAMMAFFLVMWLINASNEETRAQVASYFNPIKLTDTSTGERGLKDTKSNASTNKAEEKETSAGHRPSDADSLHESELLSNPEEKLDKIEMEKNDVGQKATKGTGQVVNVTESVKAFELAPAVGDPFEPRGWEKPATPLGRMFPTKDSSATLEPKAGNIAAGRVSHENTKGVATPVAQLPPLASEKTLKEPMEAPQQKESQVARSEAKDVTDDHAGRAAAVAGEIAAQLGTGLDELPASIDVKTVKEGTLISLTDKQSFGMFKTGSAEPEPELIRLVEAIAITLSRHPGYIVIRGHTDARPYRNKKYDNWQLSTARAHLAQYMLLRGGLDERRIRRIEGLADRDLRVPKDPQAPENRRIEILIGRDEE